MFLLYKQAIIRHWKKTKYNRQHAYTMFKAQIFKLQCRQSNVFTVTPVSEFYVLLTVHLEISM